MVVTSWCVINPIRHVNHMYVILHVLCRSKRCSIFSSISPTLGEIFVLAQNWRISFLAGDIRSSTHLIDYSLLDNRLGLHYGKADESLNLRKCRSNVVCLIQKCVDMARQLWLTLGYSKAILVCYNNILDIQIEKQHSLYCCDLLWENNSWTSRWRIISCVKFHYVTSQRCHTHQGNAHINVSGYIILNEISGWSICCFLPRSATVKILICTPLPLSLSLPHSPSLSSLFSLSLSLSHSFIHSLPHYFSFSLSNFVFVTFSLSRPLSVPS